MKKTLVILVLLIGVIGCSGNESAVKECFEAGGIWSSDTETCDMEVDTSRSECEDNGGIWRDPAENSFVTEEHCELRALDAGQSCTDNLQCEKYCKAVCADGTETCNLVTSANEEHGVCGDFYTYALGCSSTWVDGEIETICVD